MRFDRYILCVLIGLSLAAWSHAAEDKPDASSYSQVHTLFVRHCLACHDSKEAEGGFVLESHEKLMKGGETGAAIAPGKAEHSLLVKLIEHREKPAMPPPKKGDKLKPQEIAVIRAWIDGGAPGPRAGEVLLTFVPRPKIAPKGEPRRSIHALAYEPKSKLIAVARHGAVDLVSAESRAVVRRIEGHRGTVNDLLFSADGTLLIAAAGLPGELGEVRFWRIADGAPLRTIEGHHDAIYAVALSPDGATLVTGSYDQKIMLWNARDAAATSPLRTLEGHNGAVFDLAFRADGKVLASASGDRTVKLWSMPDGSRLDTLSESTQAVHAVAFAPKGDRLLAAGVDNRVRAWRISDSAKEGTNTLLVSRFAHEGAILQLTFSADGSRLATSADDRSVKLWTGDDITPRAPLEKQSDWPTALTFALDGKAVVAGRLDGTFAVYDAASGAILPPPKPEVTPVAIPFGVQRGVPREVRITGKNLAAADAVRSAEAKITGAIVAGSSMNDSILVRLTAAADIAPGTYEFSIASAGGESGKLKVLVDTIAQGTESEPNDVAASSTPLDLPLSAWGTISTRGDQDVFAFTGKAGQTIVVDAMSARLGGKANLVVTLSDPAGRVIDSNNDFDGSPDPFIAAKLPVDGRYTVAVRDLQMAGSAEHAYRLTIGELPVATAAYPLSVAENVEAVVQLTGFNLPANASVKLPASLGGDITVPIDAGAIRTRRPLKVMVTSGMPDGRETEPNDQPDKAAAMAIPSVMNGRIDRPGDADLFRFTAKKGQRLILETMASRLGSPIDTKIEVLHGDGPRLAQPVVRTLLRAVRDTAHTFRPIDANANGTRLVNWEEMAQNELLYMQGEVVKLFLPPRGPDSQWDFYTLAGKRRCYFDTSATAHALDEPCYIVEPLAPDAPTPPPNGLPIFTVHYTNDDDEQRQLGSDSRLTFVAPADGAYLVRISDARHFGGDAFAYRLIVREANPEYRVTLLGANPTVPTGSGVSFSVVADRTDGFEGAITVEIAGTPPGFHISSPLVIEAGHNEARGAIFAEPGAAAPTSENASKIQVKSRAMVDGKEVVKDVNTLGVIKLGPPPKLTVDLVNEPASPAASGAIIEISAIPGRMTAARIKLGRSGHTDLASLDVENLPHGVIVADLGLNGLLIRADENERVIFIICAPWVSEMDRLCYAKAKEAGAPTSRPVILKVRKK